MRMTLRTWTLAFAATLTGAALFGDRPAAAQNTYADVPFNQGSLFYRPSGARPPANAPPSTASRQRWRFFRRAQRNTTLAAPRMMPPRTTLARPAVVPPTTYFQQAPR